MIKKDLYKTRSYKLSFWYDDNQFNGIDIYDKYISIKDYEQYLQFMTTKWSLVEKTREHYSGMKNYSHIEQTNCTPENKEGDLHTWINDYIYDLPTEWVRMTMRADGVKHDPEYDDEFIRFYTNKHGKVYWEDYNGDASFIVDCYVKFDSLSQDVAINTILVPKAHIDEIDDEVLKQHYEHLANLGKEVMSKEYYAKYTR